MQNEFGFVVIRCLRQALIQTILLFTVARGVRPESLDASGWACSGGGHGNTTEENDDTLAVEELALAGLHWQFLNKNCREQ